MLKKLKLVNGNEKASTLLDFEFITVNRKKGALGIGSFATVKLARHKKSDKLYAIKIVRHRRVLLIS